MFRVVKHLKMIIDYLYLVSMPTHLQLRKNGAESPSIGIAVCYVRNFLFVMFELFANFCLEKMKPFQGHTLFC